METLVGLITLLTSAMAQPTSPTDRNSILEFHTEARETVNPTASDMMMMTYSQQMEELAIKWVSRCKFEHPNPTTDPDYKGIGQNLALAGTYTPNMTRMAQGWYDEIKNYKYADNSCKGVCGHYTQMVWATSVGLGCAMKQCDDIKPEWKMPVYLMACQYQPAGNMIGMRPYKQGNSCDLCPKGLKCIRKQCTNITDTSTTSTTTTTTSIATLPCASGLLVFAIFLVQGYT
uniref:SCP domain-containing protein n=1 Tax=Mesocestoides corti TaxID=53468 RepID=A0A5K3FAF2_MESCO